MKKDQHRRSALVYHAKPKPGKTEVIPTKNYRTQRDLSLAYSPGVAHPCLEIEKEKASVYKYTNKGNLVAVISNGTAVLGLGDIGPIASKPVMEGKALLFKIFAGIDVFDIEVNAKDPDKFIEAVKDKPVEEKELIDFCRETLAGFKVPKKIEFCELPKTSTGKIQKFELRKKAKEIN